MAVVLKGRKHEALAVGRFTAAPDTLDMLFRWADRIVLMEPHMRESIPPEFLPQTWTVDVGPDQWGSQVDPFLREMCEEGADFLVASLEPTA